jgi:hypothetical protein
MNENTAHKKKNKTDIKRNIIIISQKCSIDLSKRFVCINPSILAEKKIATII